MEQKKWPKKCVAAVAVSHGIAKQVYTWRKVKHSSPHTWAPLLRCTRCNRNVPTLEGEPTHCVLYYRANITELSIYIPVCTLLSVLFTAALIVVHYCTVLLDVGQTGLQLNSKKCNMHDARQDARVATPGLLYFKVHDIPHHQRDYVPILWRIDPPTSTAWVSECWRKEQEGIRTSKK